MNNRKKSAASSKKKKALGNQKVKTLEEWIEEGSKFSDEFDFEKAYHCFEEALKMDDKNTNILDTLGELSLELGRIKQAKHYFIKSIQLKPDESSSKYMNLGQITGGDDAVKLYHIGIDIMEKELQELLKQNPNSNTKTNNNNNNKNIKMKDQEDEDEEEEEEEEEIDPIIDLQSQICAGLCSIAELYLTDQCFEDNAEVECESNLLKAIKISPFTPEPYSLMASMKISQKKNEEALEYLKESYKLWESSEIDERPNFDYRFNVSLLFIELGENKIAIDILEALVNEQDNIAEIWYTLSVAYFELNEVLSAQECIQTAKELLNIAFDGRDESLEQQIQSIDVKINNAVSLLPPEAFIDSDQEDEEKDEQGDQKMI